MAEKEGSGLGPSEIRKVTLRITGLNNLCYAGTIGKSREHKDKTITESEFMRPEDCAVSLYLWLRNKHAGHKRKQSQR